MRTACSAGLLVSLAGWLGAQDPVPTPTPPAPVPAPAPVPQGGEPAVQTPQGEPAAQAPAPAAPARPKPPTWEPRYHKPEEIDAFLAALAASDTPLRVAPLELANSAQGRPVHGLVFGSPEGGELATRPTVFLVGGLDGLSLAGCEGVLAACAELFAHASELPAGLAICAVPNASPDALSRTAAGHGDGRDPTPVDDDGDGRVDEDGGDDLDGDGLILEMLVEDPEGAWTRSSDPRLLARARSLDAPRYQRLVEGRDDDGDGNFNEDPPGGIDLDLSFPVDWEKRESGAWQRPLPLASPLARSLADLWLSRRTVLVLLFQGDHGEIGIADAAANGSEGRPTLDSGAGEALATILARTAGRSWLRARGLRELYGSEHAGAALDWVHAVVGAMGAEVALWGPLVESGAGRSVSLSDAKLTEAAEHADGGPPPPAEADRAWMRWLDNTRGGIGFSDWHPVELGGGRTALVGGFDPALRRNPPEKALAAAVGPSGAFVLECLRALPELDLRVIERRRDGDVCTIRVRVENKGRLPTALTTSSRWAAALGDGKRPAQLELALGLPPGARLIAGEERLFLPELGGGSTSREVRWVATAPPNSSFSVVIQSPFTVPARREVKP